MDEEKSIYEHVAKRSERSGRPCARAGKDSVDQAGDTILVRSLASRPQAEAAEMTDITTLK
jgi:hypothetical protein